jgi:2'-5' RNA ligase
MNFKTYANLSELKTLAGGNPSKMAEVAVKQKELADIKAAHFNEQFPFVDSFSESHLAELKAYASENVDDQSAQVRYALQKERFAVAAAKKTAHLDLRQVKGSLREKLASGSVTASDLQQAAALVKRNGSEDNRVLYASIKSLVSEGVQE